MFCPNCGKELNDDAAFCGSCGSQIDKNASGKAPLPGDLDHVQQSTTATHPSVATTAKATASVVGSAAKSNPKLFIGVGVALGIVIIGVVLAVMFMTGGFTGGQTAGTFKQAFEMQQVYLRDVPPSTYTKESPYELTSCDVTDIQKKSDSWVTAKINAVIENDTYKVTSQFAADYYSYPNASRSSGQYEGDYQFEPLSRDVEAKLGISKDSEHGLNDVVSEMSEDGKSCYVNIDETSDLWFADSSVNELYTYTLGENGWSFQGEESSHQITYKDLDGSYVAKTGDMLEFSNFSISGLDAEKGSFSIKITLPEKAKAFSTRAAAEAVLQTTIDPQRNGKNAQKDGYSYYFEATGTSAGGRGTSSIGGYLTVGDDGAKTIQITSGKIDVTENHDMMSPSQSVFSFDGTLFKQ